MKVLIVLMVLVGAGIAAAYYFGGFTTLDPAAQAQAIRQEVKPGMTWEQVADLHEPNRLYPIDFNTINGEGQPIDFDRANITKLIADGGLPSGFLYKFNFSQAHAVGVTFDGAGKVLSVDDLRTTADLFTLPGAQ